MSVPLGVLHIAAPVQSFTLKASSLVRLSNSKKVSDLSRKPSQGPHGLNRSNPHNAELAETFGRPVTLICRTGHVRAFKVRENAASNRSPDGAAIMSAPARRMPEECSDLILIDRRFLHDQNDKGIAD